MNLERILKAGDFYSFRIFLFIFNIFLTKAFGNNRRRLITGHCAIAKCYD